MEIEKLMKPSIYEADMQEQLLLDRVVQPADLPSKSAISKCITVDLHTNQKKKKNSTIPQEPQIKS